MCIYIYISISVCVGEMGIFILKVAIRRKQA